VINNLLSNAIRYSPSGGEVTGQLSRAGGRIILSVSDSGSGIPVGEEENIFERFFRGDASRSRNDGGSGLGLAIARQLARAHGGDLTAENRPDGGACFILSLPAD
jgi:two-component system sensor histidine kinase BaeS